ncbi:MAG: helix-turn-helix transcriptional regulator [Treponema sp.]|nr:helix-turn-helix transcriptional regulator [Treponema sp.]
MKEILKYLRQLHSYTQEDVAQKIGISRQSYIKYESGAVVPSDKNITKLAALYEVDKSVIYANSLPRIFTEAKKNVRYQISENLQVLSVADPAAIATSGMPPEPDAVHAYDVYFDGNTLRLMTEGEGSHFIEGQRFKLVPVDSVDKAEKRRRAFETFRSFRGKVQMPENFDYKEELYKALEEKYGSFN